jgi:hypothetical protein
MTEHDKNTLMLKGLVASMTQEQQQEVRTIGEKLLKILSEHDPDLGTLALTLATAERVK